MSDNVPPSVSPRARLRRELRVEDFSEPCTGRLFCELLFHVILLLGGTVLFFSVDSWLLRCAAVWLAGLGSLGVATNTHTATHYAATRRRGLNVVWSFFGYTLVNGLSLRFWHYRHVSIHHRFPNVCKVDADIDYGPLFAVSDLDIRGAGLLRRAWHRVQVLALPLVVPLSYLNFQFSGWRYVLAGMRGSRRQKLLHAIDLAGLLLGNALWLGVLLALCPAQQVAIFLLARAGISGLLMFICFLPAHLPREAAFLSRDDRDEDAVWLQTATTVNFRAGPIAALLLSGLQYQIEHHLFPNVSHVHFRELSRRLKPYCERHGYPYRTLGWGEALLAAVGIFIHPKPALPGASLSAAEQTSGPSCSGLLGSE